MSHLVWDRVQGEGQVWPTGTMVCLLVAPQDQVSVSKGKGAYT